MTAAAAPVEIRLAGIDALEIAQAYGQEARESLERLVLGKSVMVVEEGRGYHGRRLAWLFLDGLNVNLALAREGWAWHYRRYSRDQQLAAAEARAREAGAGLWQDPDPIPPWEFRRGRRR